MKMWNKMFSGKKDEQVKEVLQDAVEALRAQDAPRTEPLQGTEAEIEKKAEDGMKEMGFKPVENNAINEVQEAEKVPETKSGKWKSRIRGNDYCPCKSNKKFKKCCALDEKKVKHFQKTMDIKIANAETTRRGINEVGRENKKLDKILQQTTEVKVESK